MGGNEGVMGSCGGIGGKEGGNSGVMGFCGENWGQGVGLGG